LCGCGTDTAPVSATDRGFARAVVLIRIKKERVSQETLSFCIGKCVLYSKKSAHHVGIHDVLLLGFYKLIGGSL
jgi:hypothetical protein